MATLWPLSLWILWITISGATLKFVQSENYIVHMDLSAMPKAFADHQSWYSATLSSLSGDYTPESTTSILLYTYTSATHGFSASLTPSELNLLQKSRGFVYAIRDVPLKAHTTHTPQYIGLNSGFGAWPESGYGKDVIIGVIDSGVWPESGSFRDQGMSEVPARWKGKCISDVSFNSSMCNKKLIGARYYSKGIVAKRPELNITGNTVRDMDGHGTHTSSIAAGNYVDGASFFGYGEGTAKGMAPRAHLAIYKVLWENHAYASDVIAGIDQAIADGVDILSISMSWGGFPLYEDPIALASYAAVQKGIFVATSAGNRGPSLFSVDNGAPWLLTVGAGTVDRTFTGTITLGNGVSVIGESLYAGNSSLHGLPLVYIDDCSDSERLNKVGHKIVVCADGDDDNQHTDDVKSAKVAGGIFIALTSHMEDIVQTSFPATFVRDEAGQPILDYIKKTSKPTASVVFHKTETGMKPAPIVGEYSSRGPSSSCPGILKPDLIAPGTMVLSSWSPKSGFLFQPGSEERFGPFNILSGTSMACPHAAGVAALLKAKHPDWSPAAIRSAMVTTAIPLDNSGQPIRGFGDMLRVASILDIGAGQINPNKAMNPGLVYDANEEDYMRFLCSTNYTQKQIKMITRSSPLNCSKPSSDVNYPSFIAFFNSTMSSSSNPKITQTFRRTVTNVGDAMSTYTAKLADIDEVKVSVVPTKLVFKHKYEKQSFTLTMKGPARMDNYIVNGSLTWVDAKGKFVVRSPLVVTRVNLEDIDD
ncbi:hypothetical protein ACHQM5_023961 [Ranunculus cassubicifolius]